MKKELSTALTNMIDPFHVHQVGKCYNLKSSVLSSHISLGSLFQALAAENLNEVWS